jgi:hypothetical protein
VSESHVWTEISDRYIWEPTAFISQSVHAEFNLGRYQHLHKFWAHDLEDNLTHREREKINRATRTPKIQPAPLAREAFCALINVRLSSSMPFHPLAITQRVRTPPPHFMCAPRSLGTHTQCIVERLCCARADLAFSAADGLILHSNLGSHIICVSGGWRCIPDNAAFVITRNSRQRMQLVSPKICRCVCETKLSTISPRASRAVLVLNNYNDPH